MTLHGTLLRGIYERYGGGLRVAAAFAKPHVEPGATTTRLGRLSEARKETSGTDNLGHRGPIPPAYDLCGAPN